MATIGTDPEFFVRDVHRGDIMPVVGLLGGTKMEPLPIPGLPEGFGAQEDNVMAELTVPPAVSAHSFADSVTAGKEGLNTMLGEDYEIDPSLPFHSFRHAQLRSTQAQMFGCSPDYNAYERGARRRRLDPETVGVLRFCGGHIHLGGTFNCPEFVSAMLADAALGAWAITMGELQGPRRQYYGLPGLYRPTSYGIEYRTLSNYWTTTEDMTFMVASRAHRLALLLEDDAERIREVHMQLDFNMVREAIAHEDANKAQRVTRVMDAALDRYHQ